MEKLAGRHGSKNALQQGRLPWPGRRGPDWPRHGMAAAGGGAETSSSKTLLSSLCSKVLGRRRATLAAWQAGRQGHGGRGNMAARMAGGALAAGGRRKKNVSVSLSIDKARGLRVTNTIYICLPCLSSKKKSPSPHLSG